MSQADAIQQHVQQYLKAHPELRGSVQRQGEGEYVIDGRPVKVGFCRQGFLVVHDGPMRQPFTDYMDKKEASAVYHNQGLKTSKLENLPKETRISFGDEGNRYSRLDAMKVAKEQAKFREKAATHMTEGGYVPSDLRENYQKAIDQKLGKRRQWSGNSSTPAAPETAAPSWWPASPPSQPPAMPAGAAANPAVPSLFGAVPDLMGVARKPPMAGGMPGMATPMVGMPGAMPMMAGGYQPRPMPGRLFGA